MDLSVRSSSFVIKDDLSDYSSTGSFRHANSDYNSNETDNLNDDDDADIDDDSEEELVATWNGSHRIHWI